MDDLFADRAVRNQTLARADIERLAGRPQILIDCDLEEADLSGLDLAGWRFERCNVRRADLSRARLEDTAWQSCRGAFANFTGSDLGAATVVASDFNNVSFKRANLQAATFDQCKLTGADLFEVKGLEIHFAETLLVNAKLAGRSFRKVTLNRIDFSQADLRKCDFRQTTFVECSLREANMDGARFDGADLRGADLGGLQLFDATMFRGATISRDQAAQLLGQLGLNVR
ncbi:pentapeptide repeat-containing protein [Novosphingobium sp. JCM 18896]|uniref:pentapeptide repeat-containing protein n=1 Tax=Novosphingobium sp. JCM 18896 TaxID=2989731 RepID=UPI002221C437|nr:pentapeptide repeat-containing protein [Novosphingobium sp. JCM 18896]MCW1430547.1 pentapeptide repeat-containing protein [Novosphingobium sp. JCM 18896]